MSIRSMQSEPEVLNDESEKAVRNMHGGEVLKTLSLG